LICGTLIARLRHTLRNPYEYVLGEHTLDMMTTPIAEAFQALVNDNIWHTSSHETKVAVLSSLDEFGRSLMMLPLVLVEVHRHTSAPVLFICWSPFVVNKF
jgi:hypothetical protein